MSKILAQPGLGLYCVITHRSATVAELDTAGKSPVDKIIDSQRTCPVFSCQGQGRVVVTKCKLVGRLVFKSNQIAGQSALGSVDREFSAVIGAKVQRGLSCLQRSGAVAILYVDVAGGVTSGYGYLSAAAGDFMLRAAFDVDDIIAFVIVVVIKDYIFLTAVNCNFIRACTGIHIVAAAVGECDGIIPWATFDFGGTTT